jgi:hypothetical protein
VPYADVEQLLTTWLPTITSVTAVDQLPTDVAAVVPLIVVTRVGGGTRTVTIDQARVDIDVYMEHYDDAKSLARTIQAAVETQLKAAHVIPSAAVGRTRCVSGPARRPWDNRNLVHRVGMTYEITVHTQGI